MRRRHGFESVQAKRVQPRPFLFASLALLCALAVCFVGCSTVIPKTVKANVASFDGGVQNSGEVCLTTNAVTKQIDGAIITPHARDRYNALIALYSTNFFPPLTMDAGITPSTNSAFRIDAQHLTEFMRMNRWHKAAAPPTPK